MSQTVYLEAKAELEKNHSERMAALALAFGVEHGMAGRVTNHKSGAIKIGRPSKPAFGDISRAVEEVAKSFSGAFTTGEFKDAILQKYPAIGRRIVRHNSVTAGLTRLHKQGILSRDKKEDSGIIEWKNV